MNIRPAVAVLCLALAGQAAFGDPAPTQIVIAHRGASGYLPEHTLEAYALAHGQGADYIEPDLVRTKDGAFVCLHDIHLELTTDVNDQFPDRARKDGRWYPADFALAEIKQLQAIERLPKRFPKGKSDFEVPTFQEMIELIQGLNATTGREVGIYPELKEPAWHRKEGLPMEEAFLKILAEYGYTGPEAKCFVQCFEPEPLQRMRGELGSTLPQVFLMSAGAQTRFTPEELAKTKAFANGIGPDKGLIDKDPGIVERAHAAGLLIHPYTLRADALGEKYATPEAEIEQFFRVYKVDGMFTDFPDRSVRFLHP